MNEDLEVYTMYLVHLLTLRFISGAACYSNSGLTIQGQIQNLKMTTGIPATEQHYIGKCRGANNKTVCRLTDAACV